MTLIPIPVTRKAYTVDEVAVLLGISPDKTYELVRANRLPHKRLGRRIIIPLVALEQWLSQPDTWEASDV